MSLQRYEVNETFDGVRVAAAADGPLCLYADIGAPAKVGSDEDRGQVLFLVMRQLRTGWPGKKAIQTYLWFLQQLASSEPNLPALGSIYLSNKMEVTYRLKTDSTTWQRVLPYLRPDCPAVRIA
jgi:hypothetical protein